MDEIKWYRFKRIVDRILSTPVTAALVVLIVGLLGYYIGNIRNQRNRARSESQKVQKTSNLMIKMIQSGDSQKTDSSNPTAKELLKKGLNDAETLTDEPEVQSQMFLSIGKAYSGLGMFEKAEQSMNKALDIRRKLHGDKGLEVAKVYEALGDLYQSEMLWDRSVFNLQKSLNLMLKSGQSSQMQVAGLMTKLAASMRDYGKVDSAEYYALEALHMEKRFYKSTSPGYLKTEEILAYVLRKKGEHQQAGEMYKRILNQVQQQKDPDLNLLSRTADDLAYLEKIDKNYDDAIAHYRQALAAATKFYGQQHPTTLMIMSNLAAVLYANKQYAETENMLRQIAEMTEKHYGENHWRTATGWEMLGKFYLFRDRNSEAELVLRKSVRIFDNTLGHTHPWTGVAEGLWAASLFKLNRDKMAESLYRDSFRILNTNKKKIDHTVRVLIVFLGNFMDNNGYHQKAEECRSLLKVEKKENGRLAHGD